MASNGFFEFLGSLKDLYDDSAYHNNWAKQYNPYNGGSSWWRGLGAINHMIDRNAGDRRRMAQQQAYKTSSNDNPTANPVNVGIGANENGVYGVGQSAPGVSVGSYENGGGSSLDRLSNTSGIGFLSNNNNNGFSSVFGGNDFSGGSLVNPKIPSTSSDSNSLAREIGGQNGESARDLSRYLSDDYNVANWM